MTDDKASIIPANPKDVPSDSRGWATAAQLSGFVSLWIIGPLIIWLIKRDEDAYVEEYAREALNFHLSMLIYGIISGILVLVIVGIFMLAVLGDLLADRDDRCSGEGGVRRSLPLSHDHPLRELGVAAHRWHPTPRRPGSAEPEEHLLQGVRVVPIGIGFVRTQPALLHRRSKESEPGLAECLVRCGELDEGVVAFATLVDHGLESPQLALDASESLDDLVPIVRWKLHAAIIPHRVSSAYS